MMSLLARNAHLEQKKQEINSSDKLSYFYIYLRFLESKDTKLNKFEDLNY